MSVPSLGDDGYVYVVDYGDDFFTDMCLSPNSSSYIH